MRNRLPPEVADYVRKHNITNVKYGSGRGTGYEYYTASCPWCGGDDRFILRPNSQSGDGRYWCRGCKRYGFFMNENGQKPSPQQVEEEQKRLEEFERKAEKKRQKKLEWLRQAEFWVEAHQNMQPSHYRLWRKEHFIQESMVKLHKLGYKEANDQYEEALTIPYLRGGVECQNIQTLQFRLCKRSQYRFMADLGQQLFFPFPVESDMEGRSLLVTEGAKKGIVTMQEMWRGNKPFTYRGEELLHVSIPAKSVSYHLLEELGKADTIIWMLDPDAYTPTVASNGDVHPPDIERLVKGAGWKKSRLVRPAGKIDDMIAKYGLTARVIQAMINGALPYMRQWKS